MGQYAELARGHESAYSSDSLAFWKCRDGRLVEIETMDKSHARNVVTMLRRKGMENHPQFLLLARRANIGV